MKDEPMILPILVIASIHGLQTSMVYKDNKKGNLHKRWIKHTSSSPPVITSKERNVRVRSSLTKTSHLLKSIQYLRSTKKKKNVLETSS